MGQVWSLPTVGAVAAANNDKPKVTLTVGAPVCVSMSKDNNNKGVVAAQGLIGKVGGAKRHFKGMASAIVA